MFIEWLMLRQSLIELIRVCMTFLWGSFLRAKKPNMRTCRMLTKHLLWMALGLLPHNWWVSKATSWNIQIVGTKNQRRWESSLYLELDTPIWAIESIVWHSMYQNFGRGCKDLITMVLEPQVCPKFLTYVKEITTLQRLFNFLSFSTSFEIRIQLLIL